VSQPVGDDPTLRDSLRRWQLSGVLILALLVVAFPAYRVVDTGRRPRALADRQAALVTVGRELWGLNCASCHGLDGQGGDGPALNAKEFLGEVADEQIHSIIAVGIPGTEMPFWWTELGGSLTDEQIAAIVAYLRSWEEDAPSRPDYRTPRPEEPAED